MAVTALLLMVFEELLMIEAAEKRVVDRVEVVKGREELNE